MLLSAGSFSHTQALDGVDAFTFIKVPNPLSGKNPRYPLIPRAVPAPGESFEDLRFGTSLTRATGTPGLRHNYSRFDPFNADGSRVLLIDPATGLWRVYRTASFPYNKPANLVRTIDNLPELWWDPKDADIIHGLRDFSIVALNVASGREKIVKDFSRDTKIGSILKREPDLYRITDKDEGEPSLDRRYWVFALQGSRNDYRLRRLFTWDRVQNKVLGIYKLSAAEAEVIDWVGMSPLGRWVVIGGGSGTVKTSGLTIVDKKFRTFHKLAWETAHSDVSLDSAGREVVVMQNTRTDYVDLIPIDTRSKTVMSVGDYRNNIVRRMVRLYYNSGSPIGLQSGVHISCNHSGYCVIGANIERGLPEQNWLDRSIILVKLDSAKPRAFYLAKVYNTTGDYWEETQASMSNDGSKVAWADNWGRNVGRGKCFLMQLDMPPGWEKLLE